jgi:hypothetical protein
MARAGGELAPFWSGRGLLAVFAAILGTTISRYLFFWAGSLKRTTVGKLMHILVNPGPKIAKDFFRSSLRVTPALGKANVGAVFSKNCSI